MSEIKRWAFDSKRGEMFEIAHGAYVEFNNHASAIATLRAEHEAELAKAKVTIADAWAALRSRFDPCEFESISSAIESIADDLETESNAAFVLRKRVLRLAAAINDVVPRYPTMGMGGGSDAEERAQKEWEGKYGHLVPLLKAIDDSGILEPITKRREGAAPGEQQ